MQPSNQIDQRRFVRYEVLDYAVCYPDDGGEPLNAVLVNIGLGGLQTRTKYPISEGSVWSIHVMVDESTIVRSNSNREEGAFNGSLPLVLRAEARHTMSISDSDLFSTGFRFIPQTHSERIAIAEYVHGIFQRQCELMTP